MINQSKTPWRTRQLGFYMGLAMLSAGPLLADASWVHSPMEEETTVVISVEEGPLPDVFRRFADEVKTELNINLEVATHPFTEQFQTQMRDLTITGRYDIVSILPGIMGDIGPLVRDLAEVSPDGFDGVWRDMQMEDVLEGYRWVAYHNGDLKAVQYDGDVKMLFYRHDLMTDSAEQEAFYAEYGYELSCPATFDQYLDISRFFTRPDENFYGNAQIAGFLSQFTFIDNYIGAGGHMFDPTDMTPLPDRTLALQAINNMVDAFKEDASAPEARSFEFGTARDQIISESRVMFVIQWPDVWKWSGDTELSSSQGNVRTCVLPGGRPDMHGGRIMMISNKSDNAEAAYKVMAFFADSNRTTQLVNDNTTWLDPWRKAHLDAASYAHLCEGNAENCEQFVETIADSMAVGYPGLNIPGVSRYREVWDRWATSAIKGEATPQEALDGIVLEMGRITENLGRDKQIAEYAIYLDQMIRPRGYID